ncbi:hypothetical protein EP7_004628 [Isosphaeraceae bacterium EP7]
MRPHTIFAILIPLVVGCGTTKGVRYVYQDKDFGVVAIPENTDHWPTKYRSQADKLMDTHFPGGHEIVRAEEVVEGSRLLTVQGSNVAELAPQLPVDLLKVAKLGHTNSRSQADSLKIKEARIIYRRSARPVYSEPFADQAEASPTQYIDPNAAERKKGVEKVVAAEELKKPLELTANDAQKPASPGPSKVGD